MLSLCREQDQKLHRGAGRGRAHNLGSERAHATPLSAGDRHLPASCVVCTGELAAVSIRSQLAAHVESEGRACSGPWTSQGVSGAWMPPLLLPPSLPMTPGGVYSPECVECEFSEVQRRCVGRGGASSRPFLRFTRSLRHSTVTRSAAVRKYISSPDRAGVSFVEVSRPST